MSGRPPPPPPTRAANCLIYPQGHRLPHHTEDAFVLGSETVHLSPRAGGLGGEEPVVAPLLHADHELAGDEFLSELDAAHERRDGLTAELERLNAELTETGRQLKTYAEGQDQSFRDAVDKTARFVKGQSLTAMRSEARDTPDVEDDEIVGAISHLADERNALDKLSKTKNEELNRAFRRKEELLRSAAEFRRSRYDAPGSVFEAERNGGTGEALLQMLLQGAITAVEYWARTQSRQRWEERSGDSYRRSSRFPSRGRSSSRSSSGGPDFRTGGGF